MKLETILKFLRQILFYSKYQKYSNIEEYQKLSKLQTFSLLSFFQILQNFIQLIIQSSKLLTTLSLSNSNSPKTFSQKFYSTPKKNLIKPLFHGILIIQKRSSKLPQITLKTPKIRRYSLRASSLPLHAD